MATCGWWGVQGKRTETRVKAWVIRSFSESSRGIVLGHQCEAESKPESTKGSEHDKWESVADDPLQRVRTDTGTCCRVVFNYLPRQLSQES